MRQSQGTPAPDPSMQPAEHAGERGTFSPFEKRFVETGFGLEHLRGVSGILGLFPRPGAPVPASRSARVAGLFRKEARGKTLQDGANSVKIASSTVRARSTEPLGTTIYSFPQASTLSFLISEPSCNLARALRRMVRVLWAMGQLVPFARSADPVKVNQRIQTLVDPGERAAARAWDARQARRSLDG